MTEQALSVRFRRLMTAMVMLPILITWLGAAFWFAGKADAALKSHAQAVASSISSTLEDALAFGQPLADLRGAEAYFSQVLRENRNIRFLALVDPERRLLLAQGLDTVALGSPLPEGDTGMAVIVPLHAANTAVGAVVVAANSLDWWSVLAPVAPWLLLALALAIVIAAVLAEWSFRRVCLQPLERITGQFDAGAAGQFEPGPPLHRRDEFGSVMRVMAVLKRVVRERAKYFADYAEEVHRVVADPAVADQAERLRLQAFRELSDQLFRHQEASPQSDDTAVRRGSLLRIRITGLVFFAVITVSVGMAMTTGYRVSLFEESADTSATASVDLGWRRLVSSAIAVLDDEVAPLAADPDVTKAVVARDSVALTAALAQQRRRFDAAKVSTDMEVTGLDGGLLYGGGGTDGSSVLGSFTNTTVLRTAESVTGLAINADHEFVFLVARPVMSGDRVVGIFTLIRDALPLVRELSGILGAEVLVLDLDGRPLNAEATSTWRSITGKFDPAHRGLARVDADGRSFAISTMGLPTIGKGRLGTLLAVRDVTEQRSRNTRLQIAFYALVALMMGMATWLVYHYVSNVFAPLNAAISALHTLASGNTNVILDIPGSEDEVGRIAAAVRVFRDRTRALTWVNEERSRRRRRQERLIRRQMLKLAETLQDGAREAVLKDLDKIEKEASLRSSGTEVAAELDALAIAFQTMAGRVHEQHRELDMLVGELREALKTKTAFIALQQELEIARELQLAILPKVSTNAEEFEAHAVMTPAKEVGGDFYDFFRLSPRKVGMVVADVSGKGVPAALFMAVSRTLLKATAMFKMAPGDCLRKLNDLLVEGNEKSLFVTVFYGILDLDTGVLTYANGGHNPPMLVSKDGMVRPLEGTGGIVLALEPGLLYEERAIKMQPGDTLVMYTDGVTEAMNHDQVMFGEGLLAERLRCLVSMSAREVTENIISGVHDFSAGCPQTDDITCFALRFKGLPDQSDGKLFTFRNSLDEVPRLREQIELFLEQFELPKEAVFNISMSLDEIFTNIVSYGYDDTLERQIEITLQHNGEGVVATIVDDGREYDPLADREEPDLEADLDERMVGGLGIFLVRTFMDQVSYQRDGQRNRLVIMKRLVT